MQPSSVSVTLRTPFVSGSKHNSVSSEGVETFSRQVSAHRGVRRISDDTQRGIGRVRRGWSDILAGYCGPSSASGLKSGGAIFPALLILVVFLRKGDRPFGDTVGCEHQGGSRQLRTDRPGRGFLIHPPPLTGGSV